MVKRSILWHIKQLRRPVFTTHELCASSGKSASGVTQALNFLAREGIIFKVCRGIWAEEGNEKLNPYAVIPFLLPRHRVYVSFISALHLYGIIEQIPQVTTLASTVHSKMMRTKLGDFRIHRINPLFFDGFDWYKGTESFLIAEPEKALIDSLYISTRKKKQFSYFPELHFPKSFSVKKAKKWIARIPERRIRASVQKKFGTLF
jgi:predicted transcriptional regulator of viral defense system